MHRPSKLLAAAVFVVALAACGDDEPGVEITEADPVAERRPVAVDTSALPPPDSLDADTLAVDSVTVASADSVAAPPPDFVEFWTVFQASVRTGNVNAVTRFAKLGEGGIPLDDIDRAYISAFTEPFKTSVLALSPRDFERDGTAREVRVVVGFDEDGDVVPEDEADTDAGIRLRFEVIDGRYRWVDFAKDEPA